MKAGVGEVVAHGAGMQGKRRQQGFHRNSANLIGQPLRQFGDGIAAAQNRATHVEKNGAQDGSCAMGCAGARARYCTQDGDVLAAGAAASLGAAMLGRAYCLFHQTLLLEIRRQSQCAAIAVAKNATTLSMSWRFPHIGEMPDMCHESLINCYRIFPNPAWLAYLRSAIP